MNRIVFFKLTVSCRLVLFLTASFSRFVVLRWSQPCCAVLVSGLTIERFCMTGGKSPIGYLTAYLTNLYLSADSEKVQEAIEAGLNRPFLFVCFLSSGLVKNKSSNGVSLTESSATSSNQNGTAVHATNFVLLPNQITSGYFSAFFPSDLSAC